MEKFEFCSASWVGVAREYIEAQCADQDISDLRLTFCERFTDAPSEIATEGDNVTGWYIRIQDGTVDVGHGVIDDADVRITADYATVLPLARTVFEGNEAGAAEAAKAVAAATAAGKMSREGDASAMGQAPFFAGMHDVLAKRTL